MSQKLALKQLTASDLTFFKWHLENHPAGKQKAINLNADVFINKLYPNVPILIEEKQGTFPLDLYIYGPGLAGEYNLQRKIQKRGSYKNYRLNGEFISDPEEDSNRFHPLQSGDFVIFDFVGDIEPVSARAVFVAQSLKADSDLHLALDKFIGSKSMVALSSGELEQIISGLGLPDEHPANLLMLEASLEDAALGGIEGIRTLRTGPYKGKISRLNLEQAKKNAQRTGRLGEEYVFNYLEQKQAEGLIEDFIWEADDNAIAPYDFQITELDGSKTFVDVKSTKGNFYNIIHISFNELLQMSENDRYDLYRVFGLDDESVQLRIAEQINEFSRDIVKILEQLPGKVRSDGISLPPTELDFGKTIKISEDE